MKLGISLATLACLLLFANPAGGLSNCRPGRSDATIQTGDGTSVATTYVVLIDCPTGPHGNCANSVVYQENGVAPGLQRQDPFKDDTCGGAFLSDTQLF